VFLNKYFRSYNLKGHDYKYILKQFCFNKSLKIHAESRRVPAITSTTSRHVRRFRSFTIAMFTFSKFIPLKLVFCQLISSFGKENFKPLFKHLRIITILVNFLLVRYIA